MAPNAINDRWLVAETVLADRVVLSVYDLMEVRPRVCVALAGSTHANVRLAPGSATVFDDRGRVLVLSTLTGERTRDRRVAL